jgi:hypothetical protein
VGGWAGRRTGEWAGRQAGGQMGWVGRQAGTVDNEGVTFLQSAGNLLLNSAMSDNPEIQNSQMLTC